MVTLCQHLQPTPKHAPIARFYTPQEFEALADVCRELGFLGVASGPFVRSSYNAADVYDRVPKPPDRPSSGPQTVATTLPVAPQLFDHLRHGAPP